MKQNVTVRVIGSPDILSSSQKEIMQQAGCSLCFTELEGEADDNFDILCIPSWCPADSYSNAVPALYLPNTFMKIILYRGDSIPGEGLVKRVEPDGFIQLDAHDKLFGPMLKSCIRNIGNINDYSCVTNEPSPNTCGADERLAPAASRKESDLLQKAAVAVLENIDFVQTAKKIFSYAKEITGAKSGYIALLNEDGTDNDVLFLDNGGLACTVDPALPMPIRGLREQAYRTGKTVCENNFMKTEWVKFMPAGHVVLNNVVFAPFRIHNKVEGVIGLANKAGDFTGRDLFMAGRLGDIAAMALKNARTSELLEASRESLQKALEKKDVLMKEIDHRVKNNLSMVVSLIHLKMSELPESVDLSGLIYRIEAIRLLHEALYQSDVVEKVKIGEYISRILDAIFAADQGLKVHVVTSIDELYVPSTTAVSIGLIVNECASNAQKHAFSVSGENRFEVELHKMKEAEKYVLELRNSGTPIQPHHNINRANTLGLRLVHALVKQLGGSIRISAEPRTTFTIQFTLTK